MVTFIQAQVGDSIRPDTHSHLHEVIKLCHYSLTSTVNNWAIISKSIVV